MATPQFLPRILAGALAVLSLEAGGCLMQANYSAMVTTADGTTVEAPLGNTKLEVGDGTVTVNRFQYVPQLLPDKSKGIVMTFEVVFKDGVLPRSIIVEDITDAPILMVLNESHPRMVKDTHWIGVSTAKHIDDPTYGWMLNLENTVKVYRFTIATNEGKVHVLRVPVFVPSQMKYFVRAQIGTG
jgi:hypothetical protein